MRCADCQWHYPAEFLNRAYIGGEGYTPPICGVCALARVNAASGVQMTRFHGEMAEDARQRALRWRHQHPEHAPRPS